MAKKPKTEGLEWLIHSLMAFNGSGYADMNSAEDFLESYICYKAMRKKHSAVAQARSYKEDALPIIAELLDRTYGASRQPVQKNLDKFQAFRKNNQASLL